MRSISLLLVLLSLSTPSDRALAQQKSVKARLWMTTGDVVAAQDLKIYRWRDHRPSVYYKHRDNVVKFFPLLYKELIVLQLTQEEISRIAVVRKRGFDVQYAVMLNTGRELVGRAMDVRAAYTHKVLRVKGQTMVEGYSAKFEIDFASVDTITFKPLPDSLTISPGKKRRPSKEVCLDIVTQSGKVFHNIRSAEFTLDGQDSRYSADPARTFELSTRDHYAPAFPISDVRSIDIITAAPTETWYVTRETINLNRVTLKLKSGKTFYGHFEEHYYFSSPFEIEGLKGRLEVGVAPLSRSRIKSISF